MNELSARKIAPLFAQQSEGPNLQQMADYMLVEKTALPTASAILAFGNRHCTDAIATECGRLYWGGFSRRIIATGGKAGFSGATEAEEITRKLVAMNIPRAHILTETKGSENTQQNVLFAKEHAEEEGLDIKSIIGVGNILAGRRFLMTLEQNWKGPVHAISNVWAKKDLRDTWATSPQMRLELQRQVERIPGYIEQGFIREIDLNALNQRIRKHILGTNAGVQNTHGFYS